MGSTVFKIKFTAWEGVEVWIFGIPGCKSPGTQQVSTQNFDNENFAAGSGEIFARLSILGFCRDHAYPKPLVVG